MKLKFVNKPSKTALLIYPVFEKETVRDRVLPKILARLAAEKEFEAKSGQTFFLFEKAKSLPVHVLLLGLGKPNKLNVSEIMSAFGGAVKQTT
jgi:hypothetical protein